MWDCGIEGLRDCGIVRIKEPRMQRLSPVEFKQKLEGRTTEFAVRVFKLLDAFPKRNSTQIIAYQLGKSASSIGANYREANRAESRDDFIHKIAVSVKEASESCYWLEVLQGLYPMHGILGQTYTECLELRNLLQSIRSSATRKKK